MLRLKLEVVSNEPYSEPAGDAPAFRKVKLGVKYDRANKEDRDAHEITPTGVFEINVRNAEAGGFETGKVLYAEFTPADDDDGPARKPAQPFRDPVPVVAGTSATPNLAPRPDMVPHPETTKPK